MYKGKEDRKMKRRYLFIILCLPAILVAYSAIYALNHGNLLSYFYIPLYSAINIIIAIVFAYYLTQYNQERRQLRETVCTIIHTIINIFNDECMYNIIDQKCLDKVRIAQRSVSNRLALLQKAQDKFLISEDVTYVKEQMDGYWNLISYHLDDFDYLRKSNKELYNYIANISDRLESVNLHLYLSPVNLKRPRC